MTPPTLTSRKALLAVLLAGTMALGACGRRGRPEPPPNPNAPVKTEQGRGAAKTSSRAPSTFTTRPGTVAQDDDDDDDDPNQRTASESFAPQTTPTGRKKAQPFEVPKEPFILDSIL